MGCFCLFWGVWSPNPSTFDYYIQTLEWIVHSYIFNQEKQHCTHLHGGQTEESSFLVIPLSVISNNASKSPLWGNLTKNPKWKMKMFWHDQTSWSGGSGYQQHHGDRHQITDKTLTRNRRIPFMLPVKQKMSNSINNNSRGCIQEFRLFCQ